MRWQASQPHAIPPVRKADARSGIPWCPAGAAASATSDGSRSISFCRPGEHIADLFEAVHALGAAAQFAGRLRTAQQQHADQRRFGAAEVERFAQPVLVLRDAPVGRARAAGQAVVFKAVQRLAHIIFIEIHHRLAVRALIARVDQRVQRERVVVRRGYFFFDKCAQDAGFGGGERIGSAGGMGLFCHCATSRTSFWLVTARFRVSRK